MGMCGSNLIPFVGTTLGAAMVFFIETRNERKAAESAARICFGGYDRSIGMVSAASGD